MSQIKRKEEERLDITKRCDSCNSLVSVDDLVCGVCSHCNNVEQQMLDD